MRELRIKAARTAIAAAEAENDLPTYKAAVVELNKVEFLRGRETFAEYYEIGLMPADNSCVFTVEYHGSCTECGFTWEYTTREEINSNET